MHQVVILTTHEISAEGLRAIWEAAAKDATPKQLVPGEHFAGTAFKLKDTVEIPTDAQSGLTALGPQNITPIYGDLAL